MSKIVISGYYGFGNAGDEAMLSAILEAIYKVLPYAKITVISGNPTETKRKHGVNAVPRLAPLQVFRAISECDILISGGGSLLQDITSKRSLYYYLAVISLAKFLGKKVMLYAQGIGPLLRQSAKKSVAKVVNTVDYITVRDEISKNELLSLGVTKPTIEVTADAVLSMHPVDPTIGKRLLKDYQLQGSKPCIGVSVRSWKDKVSYRKTMAETLDKIVRQYDAHVVFIPMQYPDDAQESQEIADLMDEKAIVLQQSYTTTELLSLTGIMDIVVGVRLHALVFASLMEKAVVGVSYDPKIDSFLHMIDKEAVSQLDPLDGDALYTELSRLLDNPHLNDHSLQRIRELREISLRNAHRAFALLEKAEKEKKHH